MHRYVLGDRPISSAIPLKRLGMRSTPTRSPVLEVTGRRRARRVQAVRDWHHRWLDPRGRTVIGLVQTSSGYLMRFPRQCDFAISTDAAHIAVRPHRVLSSQALEHLLADQVLPRCLAQRGELVVHGACVEIGGRLALFIGESGRGKSTLAALLLRRGHRVLTDDCVLLRPAAGSVRAVATYPSLRLNADSARAIFPKGAPHASASYSDKQRIALDLHRGVTRSRQLAAVYYLGAARSRDVAIAPVSPSAACIRLMEQTFQLDVVDRKAVGRLLTKAARVTAQVPGFSLEFPRSFRRTDALVHGIERHLAGLVDRPGGHG